MATGINAREQISKDMHHPASACTFFVSGDRAMFWHLNTMTTAPPFPQNNALNPFLASEGKSEE